MTTVTLDERAFAMIDEERLAASRAHGGQRQLADILAELQVTQ